MFSTKQSRYLWKFEVVSGRVSAEAELAPLRDSALHMKLASLAASKHSSTFTHHSQLAINETSYLLRPNDYLNLKDDSFESHLHRPKR